MIFHSVIGHQMVASFFSPFWDLIKNCTMSLMKAFYKKVTNMGYKGTIPIYKIQIKVVFLSRNIISSLLWSKLDFNFEKSIES